MALYTNHTRFSAVLTVAVTNVSDPKAALKIVMNSKDLEMLEAPVGHHDFLVEPGRSLDVSEGTQATIFSIRSCP